MREPLDDDLADAIAGLDVPAWHELPVERAREVEDALFAPESPPPVDVVRDLAFEGPGEARRDGRASGGTVPVRLYRDAPAPAPLLVFFHGGGWVLGTLDSADDLCRELARRAGCAVLSVDYRLAPEHPYPAALEDAVAALAWAEGAADDLGADPDRLGVAGSSAGGNLAAAAALRARAAGGPAIAAQLLLYPALAPDFETDAYREGADGPLLTRADMRWFWRRYCPDPADWRNPYAAPLRADDLAGLPPAVVVTAGHDPVRDDGVAYARRLAEAGVPVEHLHHPAMTHGFLSFADRVPAADAAFDVVADALRGALE